MRSGGLGVFILVLRRKNGYEGYYENVLYGFTEIYIKNLLHKNWYKSSLKKLKDRPTAVDGTNPSSVDEHIYTQAASDYRCPYIVLATVVKVQRGNGQTGNRQQAIMMPIIWPIIGIFNIIGIIRLFCFRLRLGNDQRIGP
jgi:hypothetical protein